MKEKINRVLLVDDDEVVLSTLSKVTAASGLESEMVGSGMAALKALDEKEYELIIMDINMPGLDGFEVIKMIRGKNIKTPIIIVSGRKDDFDTLYGLDIGADDYITKPFNPVTLGAKMKALIRRSHSSDADANSIIKAGPFEYNTSTLRFYKNGVEIELTSKENSLIKLFLDNVNRIFTKDMLYDMIWGNDIVDSNSIMVYMNRIRQKIEDDPNQPKYIQTVRGIGYRFVA